MFITKSKKFVVAFDAIDCTEAARCIIYAAVNDTAIVARLVCSNAVLFFEDANGKFGLLLIDVISRRQAYNSCSDYGNVTLQFISRLTKAVKVEDRIFSTR